MKIAIIKHPDLKDLEKIHFAVEQSGMTPIEFSWNDTANTLPTFQGYIILTDEGCSPQSIEILRQQSEMGKPILGIDAGARLLAESGLVPGIENHKKGLSLTHHPHSHPEEVYMRLSEGYQYNAFTRLIKSSQILRVPANAENYFVIPSGLLLEMQFNGLNVFQYCNAAGAVKPVNNFAAVSNKNGNVLAMACYPEFLAEDPIICSMREYIVEGYKQHAAPLCYYPR